MKLKRLLSGALAAAVALTTMALTPFATASAEDLVASGQCGENVTWSLDKTTGILTISGTGAWSYVHYTMGIDSYKDVITEVVVEEGVTDIASNALSSQNISDGSCFPNIEKITLASTVKTIGTGAFWQLTNLKNCDIPESVNKIGEGAFSYTAITSVNLYEGMDLGGRVFEYCPSLTEVTIPKNLSYRRSTLGGMGNDYASQLFNGCTAIEKVTIEGCGDVYQNHRTSREPIKNGLPEKLFDGCKSLQEVVIKCDDLEYVTKADSSSEYTSETFETLGTNITYTVIKGSTTEKTLRDAVYITDDNVVYITNFNALTEKITEAESIDTSLYTDDSVKALTDAIAAAKTVKENAEAIQADVDATVKVIDDAIAGLTYKSADYSAVEAAKAKVPADLSIYTDETAKAVTDAVAAVAEGKNITEQSEVDAYAKAIEDAIEGLKLKPTGGNVSGTINVSDKNAETEMTVTALAEDGTKTTVKATSMGTYKLENLAAGDYTLTISGGKYAPRNYEITVKSGDNAQDVKLNPYGDINGDGKVTTADVGMANSHAKGVKTLTDYDFVCADAKIDGSITTADVGMINSHAKGVKSLW